jgi:hypothetical protein
MPQLCHAPKFSARPSGAALFSYPQFVPASTADDDLVSRQARLRQEAAALLEELDQSAIFADIGPLALAGSFVSELMCWRELDLMLLVGADYSPREVLQLISRVLELPGVVGFDYRDERAHRSPTGQLRDERYHVPFMIDRDAGIWRLDLTLWLNDLHQNITAWHESLRDSITGEQRAAVLRIKDVWFRLPSYPDQVSGLDIYTAVIEDGVRTAAQFRSWLAERGLPV